MIELRASIGLALIFFLRMSGLFLLLPVFVLYAGDLPGATPTLIGIAFGIYGLTQAMFQVPFGMLSDRIGRKPVITLGLLVFAVGSVIAGMAESIWIILIGRMLQGAGAIAATVMALAADLTSVQQRTKTMALIGMSIGVAFALSFVLGPILTPLMGVPGLFFLGAGLALLALLILFVLVPTPESSQFHDDTDTSIDRLYLVLRDRNLINLNAGIFILHTLLMTSFVVLPVILRDITGLASGEHWHVYLPVLLVSVIIMLPFIIFGEKHHKTKFIFTGAIILLMLSQLGLFIKYDSINQIMFMLVLFFTAFNYLEATLPSLISKIVNPSFKGTALGVYATSQFLGTFTGGLIGGFVHDHFGFSGVFMVGVLVSIIWLILTSSMLTLPETT